MSISKAEFTIVIPAFNEEKTIANVVSVAARSVEKVIVVDDASKDNTSNEVKKLDAPNVELLRNEKNQGKSESIKIALQKVTTPYVMFIDADLRGLSERHIEQLSKSVDEKTPMVIGLRDKKNVILNAAMRMMPKVSGERIIKTEMAQKASEDPLWRKYGMEMVLNWYVRKHAKAKCIRLKGLDHTSKIEKQGVKSVGRWVWEGVEIGHAITKLGLRRFKK